MKQNKDIKKGDKIWMYCECLDEREFHTVISVRRVRTMVEVVVKAKFFDKELEITMYGHQSSSLLSGYEKYYYNHTDIGYTCDYELIRKKTERYNRDQRYKDAGIALLNVAKYLK